MNATELLTKYRAMRSESAFAELVRRYANLIYSVAQRRLLNSALAEEVTQAVFVRFAQNPPKLKSEPELVAWFHRTTVHVAIDVWRSETRRRAREQHAFAMQSNPTEDDQLWAEITPILDEALDTLGATDRRALLLRFFEHKAMREVGELLGVSEDAAKMRISRALDRLRGQLASRGVTCAAAALATLLTARSMEAAPASLVAAIGAFRIPLAASSGSAWEDVFSSSTAKIAAGFGILAIIGAGSVAYLRKAQIPSERSTTGGRIEFATREGRFPKISSVVNRGQAAPMPEVARIALHVADADTGAGLSKARIHVAYFYAGGRGESHDFVTDRSGTAAIPEPFEGGDKGMNVFVVAEGHVPKCVSFQSDDARREYTLRLAPGVAVRGLVLDPDGQPVPGVEIKLQNGGGYKHGAENVDFQLCSAATDENGRWTYSYAPEWFEELRFILTHVDYAVTLPVVPTAQVSLTNLIFVLQRGFVLEGVVADLHGRPIAGAQVKELHNRGYRQQTALTDDRGRFVLKGIGEFDSVVSPLPERGQSNVWIIRGMTGQSEAYVNLEVSAEGFAPVIRKTSLPQQTNSVALQLSAAKIFRGRVLNEAGDPIAGAVVRTDANSEGIVRFLWSTTTDQEGRFEWRSAPAEPTLFWFEAAGYEWKRGMELVADESDHEIRLKRAGQNAAQ